jgi:hypothetical protein
LGTWWLARKAVCIRAFETARNFNAVAQTWHELRVGVSRTEIYSKMWMTTTNN